MYTQYKELKCVHVIVMRNILGIEKYENIVRAVMCILVLHSVLHLVSNFGIHSVAYLDL
jgi:hypothetical protein